MVKIRVAIPIPIPILLIDSDSYQFPFSILMWLKKNEVKHSDTKQIYSVSFCKTFTFTFMHLADAFIQSDLHCIQVTVLHLISSCFPWESNPWS